jgi:creatinine amidohydrolase
MTFVTAIHAAEYDYSMVFPPYYSGEIFEAKHQPEGVAYSAGLEMQLLQETSNETARNGCKKIILANGHGGDSYFLPYFAQTQLASPRDYVVYVWDVDNVNMKRPGRPAFKHRHDGHAGEAETSLVLMSRPDLVQLNRAGQENWRALHRLQLPQPLFTCLSWYSNYPNHYAGGGSVGNKGNKPLGNSTWQRTSTASMTPFARLKRTTRV